MPRLVFGSLPPRAAGFDDRACEIGSLNLGGAAPLLGRLHYALLSDEALVSRLQSGNADALTVLFERHGARLFGIARRILRNDAEAEDAIQQTFLDVFRSIQQFNPDKATFRTWLVMFAYQRIFNHRRSLTAHQVFKTDSLDELLPELHGKAESAQGLSMAEMGILIEQVLSRLQPHQRRTIELVYYEGLTAEEVAKHTGETVRVVRHNLYRGLETLRKAFAKGAPE
jgi:RNA polymerase sigma-70 factor (ECF subfamily)